jgi:hypothetical protein
VRAASSSSIELVPPSRVDTLDALRLLAAKGPRDVFVEVLARILSLLGSGRASWFPGVEIARIASRGRQSELRVFSDDETVPPIVVLLDVPLDELVAHAIGNPRVARHVLAERAAGVLLLVPSSAPMALARRAPELLQRAEWRADDPSGENYPTLPAPPRADLLELVSEGAPVGFGPQA